MTDDELKALVASLAVAQYPSGVTRSSITVKLSTYQS
jgi:hypothetical protein